jgi:hypothetical protein
MSSFVRFATFLIAIFQLAAGVHAGTIIKLSLGSDAAPDIDFSGGSSGVLGTSDDGNAATTGDQNTSIEFADFLDAGNPDIASAAASFSMDNLVASGSPSTFGPLVIQNFTGGTLNLYSPTNVLLLSGSLANSALTGPLGPPATGALFTTSFASITGGTLQPMILPNTLTLSMSLTDINNGAGFSLGGATSPVLNAFRADVSLNIAAEQIPEPLSVMLLVSAGIALAAWACRRR